MRQQASAALAAGAGMGGLIHFFGATKFCSPPQTMEARACVFPAQSSSDAEPRRR